MLKQVPTAFGVWEQRAERITVDHALYTVDLYEYAFRICAGIVRFHVGTNAGTNLVILEQMRSLKAQFS